MCLISVCPKGTEKNSQKVIDFIKSGADCNKQGSGFAFKRNGENTITVNKGFFEVDLLIAAIKKSKLEVDDELIIHHRIGTSGEVSIYNCHPFVISKVDKEVSAVDIVTNKPCLVHNGVFSGITNYMKLNPKMSDTYAFTRHIMSDENILNIFMNNKELFETIMDDVVGSDKLCVLYPDRDLQMYGKFVEKDGYFHSNGGYCSWVYNRGGVETTKDSNRSTIGFGNRFRERHTPQFSESSKSFDLTTPLALLPAITNDESRKLSKIILLDSDKIDLTIDNFKHFSYIKKDIYDNASDTDKIMLFEVHNLDLNASLQATRLKETPNVTLYDSIPTLTLLHECYFIPKGGYYYQVYDDYFKLINLAIVPTLNGIKTLKKSITYAYRKTALDPLVYKKVDRKFCKLALEMHLKDLEKALEANSLQPVLELLH